MSRPERSSRLRVGRFVVLRGDAATIIASSALVATSCVGVALIVAISIGGSVALAREQTRRLRLLGAEVDVPSVRAMLGDAVAATPVSGIDRPALRG